MRAELSAQQAAAAAGHSSNTIARRLRQIETFVPQQLCMQQLADAILFASQAGFGCFRLV